MRIVIRIVAVLLILAGCVWFLQGVGVMPGSFMTGQTRWAVIGAICAVAGIALVRTARRR